MSEAAKPGYRGYEGGSLVTRDIAMATCAALRYGRDAKLTPAKPPRSVQAAKTLKRFSDDPGVEPHSCLRAGGGVTDLQSVAGMVQRDARLPFIKSPVKAETGDGAGFSD